MSVMVITGGTAGAGKATALRFARAGQVAPVGTRRRGQARIQVPARILQNRRKLGSPRDGVGNVRRQTLPDSVEKRRNVRVFECRMSGANLFETRKRARRVRRKRRDEPGVCAVGCGLHAAVPRPAGVGEHRAVGRRRFGLRDEIVGAIFPPRFFCSRHASFS